MLNLEERPLPPPDARRERRSARGAEILEPDFPTDAGDFESRGQTLALPIALLGPAEVEPAPVLPTALAREDEARGAERGEVPLQPGNEPRRDRSAVRLAGLLDDERDVRARAVEIADLLDRQGLRGTGSG